jgi:RNA recognition motif-containing protein
MTQPQAPAIVPTQIFVRNIPYRSTGASLGTLFKSFGNVTNARIITERRFGELRSLGFGFVDFETAEGAAAAVNSKDPIVLDGRTLTVRAARPRALRKRDTIFVSGIPEGATQDDLKAHFAKYNPISVRIVRANSKDVRGFAFVQFDTEENQTLAHKENRIFKFKGGDSMVQFARRAQPNWRRGTRRGGPPVRAARAPPAAAAERAATPVAGEGGATQGGEAKPPRRQRAPRRGGRSPKAAGEGEGAAPVDGQGQ